MKSTFKALLPAFLCVVLASTAMAAPPFPPPSYRPARPGKVGALYLPFCMAGSLIFRAAVVNHQENRELTRCEAWRDGGNCDVRFIGGLLAQQMADNYERTIENRRQTVPEAGTTSHDGRHRLCGRPSG